MELNPVAESWNRLVTEWEDSVWPTMQARGFRKDTAFQCWQLNRVANLLERATETDEEREERKADEELQREADAWRQ